MEVLDHPIEDLGIRPPRDEAHLLHGGHDPGGVPGHRPLQEGHHPATHRLRHLRRGTEVEEHQHRRRVRLGGGLHQQVPGVGIGVVVAVHEDLLAEGLHAGVRQLSGVEAGPGQGRQIRDADPAHPLGGEHALRRQPVDHPGDAHGRGAAAALEVGGDAAEGIGLLAIVELGEDHPPDLLVDGVEPVVGHHPAQEPDDPPQRTQIRTNNLLDVEVLDLDRHLLARVQARPVHLGAMPLSVAAAVERFGETLQPGDLLLDCGAGTGLFAEEMALRA